VPKNPNPKLTDLSLILNLLQTKVVTQKLISVAMINLGANFRYGVKLISIQVAGNEG
jgi:hypothetical protein